MAKSKSPSKFVSLREVVRASGRDYQTVKHWVDQGLLPSVPTPRGWKLVPRAALEKFLIEGPNKTPVGAGVVEKA